MADFTTPARLSGRIEARLREIDDAGLRRTLRPPHGIDLSSNDYLGLARDPRVCSALAGAAMIEGTGSTGSRLLRGDRHCFAAVELAFAQFKKTASSLYFSTGWAANLSVLSVYAEADDVIFSDEKNHASLIDGMRLSRARRVVYRHADVDHLRELLSSERCKGQKFVVTESLFSMDGDAPDLEAIAALCREEDAALIVDEAHAVGVYGARGSGMIEECGVESGVFLSVNTAGKALGVAGAFVAGDVHAIDYLVQRARPFIFSTAPPPPVAAAIDEALRIVEGEPARRATLRAKALRLRALLDEHATPALPGTSQILGIVIGENEATMRVAEELQRRGFDVRGVRPPTVPPGTSRLRVSVNLAVSDADLERFASELGSVRRELNA
ncbi:MAG: 8-amino-7-oxononanoate synthase [Acidobacteria bacterium]|nr:8-amino-7-oxononanoate synthase [Acidobacteriota bacterium]